MDFADFKKAVEKEIDLEPVDFIKENSGSISIGYLQINATQRLIFSVQEYRGRRYFDIRTWYQADSGQWNPTKKGVHLTLDKFEAFQHLCSLIEKAIPLSESAE